MEDFINKKLEKFISQFKSHQYKKGEFILRGGDMPQGVNFLQSGFAKLSSVSAEGKELTFVIYKAGDFFPVVWSFFGKRASIYSYEAITPATIIRVPRQMFINFLESNTDVFMEVTKHIIRRFQESLRTMEFLAFGNSRAKVASVLLRMSRSFGEEKKNGLEIQVPLTHRDIANIVGVTRETVSIEMKKFEKEGFISNHSKLITIRNKKGLEEEAILG